MKSKLMKKASMVLAATLCVFGAGSVWADPVAEIVGGDSYELFTNALAHAQNGDTIRLLSDVDTGTAKIQLKTLKDVVIDLNDFTWTAGYPSGAYSIGFNNCTNLTLKNGTIDATEYLSYAIYCYKSTVSLENVFVKSASISSIATFNPGSVSISGDAAKLDKDLMEGCNADITKCLFMVKPKEIPAGHYTYDLGDGMWLVTKERQTARIVRGGESITFTTVPAAVEAAVEGETVLLMDEVAGEATVEVGKSIAFDCFGNVWSNAVDGAALLKATGGASVSVTNSLADGFVGGTFAADAGTVLLQGVEAKGVVFAGANGGEVVFDGTKAEDVAMASFQPGTLIRRGRIYVKDYDGSDAVARCFDAAYWTSDDVCTKALVPIAANGWEVVDANAVVATIGECLRFTNVVMAVDVATNGATVTVIRDCADDATAQTDITFETVDGAVYGGPFFNGGHSVKTTLGSLFGTNLIEELDWTDSGLTLVNQTNGTWKVCPAATAMAQIRWTNRPTEVFDSVQSAFAWLRAFVGENPGEALNTYGIDVIGDGEHALDLGGQQLNWSINVSNETSTTTVTNGEIRGNFTVVQGDGGTVVFDTGVRMPDARTAFQGGAAQLIVKKGAYINDPSDYCEEGYLGAMRAKPDLTGMYVIYSNSEVQVSMTDRGGHVIHFKTLQDAFDLATSVISPLPNPAEIRLCNNLTDLNATNRAGDANFMLVGDPNGVNGPAMTVNGGRIVVEDGLLSASNITFDAAQIVVNGANGCIFTAGDDLEIKNATDGAVVVESGAKMVVDGKNIQIWDNNGTNVVVRNPATGLVLVRDDDGTAASGQKSRIGIWCDNFKGGEQFGTVDASFPHERYCDGDISVAEPAVYFTNDRDATLHHGRGAAIVGPAEGEKTYLRWTGGFGETLLEGDYLLSRGGSELVWLACADAPGADEYKVVGRTAYTLTIGAETNCDYAAICGDGSVTNWISVTEARYAAAEGTFTFTNLLKFTEYEIVKRRSITAKTLVSEPVSLGTAWTSAHDAADLAQAFDALAAGNGKFGLDESAESALVSVKTGPAKDGYVVTLKGDVPGGVTLWDDVGLLTVDLKGQSVNTTADYLTSEPTNGLTFAPAGEAYQAELKANVTILNGSIFGGRPTSGIDATNEHEGELAEKDAKAGGLGIGAVGCENVALFLTNVTVEAGGYFTNRVLIAVGEGGKGIHEAGGAGCDGCAGLAGAITLTAVDTTVIGGDGGNGGSSTEANGGRGGNGGAAVASEVVIESLVDCTFKGGRGGMGGASGKAGGKAGDGGNGGMALNAAYADKAESGSYEGGQGGKGGSGKNGAADGDDGTAGLSGKPAAPAAPAQVVATTGETIAFVADRFQIYDLYDADGNLVASFTNDTDTVTTNVFGAIDDPLLASNAVYTIANRFTANGGRGEPESYENAGVATTLFWTADALRGLFGGKVDVALDAAGRFALTLTDSVAGGVELPDNLGPVTLDIGAYDIVGANGAEGAPGEDGRAAITFLTPAEKAVTLSNPQTELTLVGTGTLVGGNGGDSLMENEEAAKKGGDGAPAIDYESTWLKVAVTLDGPTLVGGNGGKGGDALTGSAGTGGRGGDAVGAYVDLRYVSGGARGGNGGVGGNSRDKSADAQGGEGGAGGDANVYDDATGEFVEGSVGGNGGNGGTGPLEGIGGAAGKGWQYGVPGGSAGRDVRVRIGDPKLPTTRWFSTLEEAFEQADDGDTLTVFEDCTVEDPIDDFATGVKLETADGAKITLANDLNVNPDVKLTLAEGCDIVSPVDGMFVVEGTLVLEGGTVGAVEVVGGGEFRVPQDSPARVEGTISAEDGANVYLFGGVYAEDPSAYVSDPYKVEGSAPDYRVVLNPVYEGMALVDGEQIAFEDVNELFEMIREAPDVSLCELHILKDFEVTDVLIDQNEVDLIVEGNGKRLVDHRVGEACDSPLFTLAGNVTLRNLTVDGDGQRASFIRLDQSEDIVFENCTFTGYVCDDDFWGKTPLVFLWSQGENARLVLDGTVITGNVFSCAFDTREDSAAAFSCPVYVKGATTVTDNDGEGLVSHGRDEIVLDGVLSGGWVDVSDLSSRGERPDSVDGQFAVACGTAGGAEHFRSVVGGLKVCGKVEGDKVVWTVDERQYVVRMGETYCDTLAEALAAFKDGDTLLLLRDLTVDTATSIRLETAESKLVIDLNGKTLTNDGDKLKFVRGDVVISNGVFTATSDRSLYLSGSGATVTLGDGLTLEGAVYVNGGRIVTEAASLAMTGAFSKTSTGTIDLAAGRYAADPSAYVRADFEAVELDVFWKVIPAKYRTADFGDGYEPVVTFDEDGSGKVTAAVDLSKGAGKIFEESTVRLAGVAPEAVMVTVPNEAWIATKASDGEGGTLVSLAVNWDLVKPVLAGFDLVKANELRTDDQATVIIENAYEGFVYRLVCYPTPGSPFGSVIPESATRGGKVKLLAVTGPVEPGKVGFFRVSASTR